MTSWMLDLWFDLQLTYFYFWSTYDFGQRMTRYDSQRLDEWFFAIYEPTSTFIFGQFSVARKLILNGGAIRPIGLLFSISISPNQCSNLKTWWSLTHRIPALICVKKTNGSEYVMMSKLRNWMATNLNGVTL